MDVRFYPAAAGSALPGDPSNLDFAQCLGYYNYNKVIIPAGVNSSCCCPGRLPADRSWGSVGAGRFGAGGCAERGGRARRCPRGRRMPGPRKLRSAGPGGSSCRGRRGARPGEPALGSEGCERQAAGKSSGRRSCSPWPANKGASRARSGRGGVGTCRTFPGREPRRLPARRAERGGLGCPVRRGRSLPLLSSLGSAQLCYGQFLTRGLSKREDYLKVHQLLVQRGN